MHQSLQWGVRGQSATPDEKIGKRGREMQNLLKSASFGQNLLERYFFLPIAGKARTR